LRASREAKENFLASAKLLKILKSYRTSKFYKNLKQTNIKEKAWKRKNENKKLEKLEKLTSSCVVYVSSTSYKNKNTRNIYVKISNKILCFPTHLKKKSNLGSTISSRVPSSLHSKNIFSFILAARPNGHNLDPINLLWEVLLCIKEQNALLLDL